MARALTLFAVPMVVSLAALGAAEPALRNQTAAQPAQVAASAHFSAALVKALLAQTIEDTEEFDERILRASMHNVARSTTSVDAELIDDPDNVVVDLLLQGTTLTESHGWQRPVHFYTFSRMPFGARKRICVNRNGVSSTAASVSLNSTTSLNGMTNRKDRTDFLLSNLAQRIYYRSQAEANQQIEQNSRQRIGKRVDAEATERLQQVQPRFDAVFDLLEKQLKRPHELRFSSTATSANVALRLSDGDKIASPPSLPASWDIAFRVHERIAADLACTALAGKTYPLDEIDALAEEPLKWLARMEPNSNPVGGKPPEDAVTITFAPKDPLLIDFADQRIKLVITTTNYRAGGQDYQGFCLRLSFQVASENGRFVVVRDGPAHIEATGLPTEKQRKLPRIEQTFLRQAFEQGTERIPVSDMNLSAIPKQFGVLIPETLEARNHWLILAWRANVGRKD